jgi:excisionase family DNA binding protein
MSKVSAPNDVEGRRSERHFLSIADVANFLQVSTRTVRRWIEKKRLVAHRIDGVVRISEADFRSFLAAHRDHR